MNYVENGSTFVIRWSSRGLEAIINITDDAKQHILSLLMEDDMTEFCRNPVRDWVVDSVINKRQCEIWQVTLAASEQEIIDAFSVKSEEVKTEIRSVGELIYTATGI